MRSNRLLYTLLRRLLEAHVGAFEPVPLPRWIDEVEREYQSPPRARSTRLRVMQAARLAADLAGGPDATTAALDAALLDRMASRLAASGLRSATANGLLRGLRATCSLAEERGWLGLSPFAGWAGWLPDDPEPLLSRHHSRAEVGRVLARLRSASDDWRGHRLYALAMTWAYAGLRRDEALHLELQDIDLDGHMLAIKPRRGRRLKTRGSAGMVPMPGVLAGCLRAWLPRVGEGPWAFPNWGRTGPWRGGTVGRRPADRLKAEAESVGVKGMTPHTLRHSLATHLRTFWGLEPSQVQLVLRHSHQATQAHYVHRDRAELAALVRGFDFDAPSKSSA